jgi:hypothetical protein
MNRAEYLFNHSHFFVPATLRVRESQTIKLILNHVPYETNNKPMKLFLLVIVIFLNLATSAQVTSITSIGTGYETSRTAIPVQLTAGINFRRSEFVIGYSVFFHPEIPHRGDGGLPHVYFFRYGMNILSDKVEVIPLIGAGIVTSAILHDVLINNHYELVATPMQFKVLYGLKIQKEINSGGLFISYEHCRLSYFNLGMFIRIV